MSLKEAFSKIRVWGVPGILDFASKRWRWWCLSRRFRRMSRRESSGASEPVRGLTLIGDFCHGASNSKTMRDFAHALKDAGIPFQTFSTDRKRTIPERDFADILTPEPEFRLNRYTHVVEMFRSPLPRDLVRRRARIAFWEGEHGMLEVWPFLAGKDPVIAMSDFNADYFRRDLKPAPVHKILYPLRPIDLEIPDRTAVRKRFGIGDDAFVVLFTFDFGSFARKNPCGAMRAFARAFQGDGAARLVFKTMGAKAHPGEVALLRNLSLELGIASRFVLITEYLPHEVLYGLTASCDVYMSLHRGEGFGIGMAEAMLFGKPVVATDWSANTEFCRPGASFPVPYRLVRVEANEYFACMKEWADPDIEAAARALLTCRMNSALAREVGERGRRLVNEHFSTERFKRSVDAFLDAADDGGGTCES